jgi:DNA-binding transcriptional ArsR family regulator
MPSLPYSSRYPNHDIFDLLDHSPLRPVAATAISIPMDRFTHPDLKDVTLTAVLHALADPNRRAILRRLAADKQCEGKGLSCAMAAPANLPKATMSNHYTVLRNAGLVRAERRGTEVVHAIRCTEVEARFPGVLSAVLAVEVEGPQLSSGTSQ